MFKLRFCTIQDKKRVILTSQNRQDMVMSTNVASSSNSGPHPSRTWGDQLELRGRTTVPFFSHTGLELMNPHFNNLFVMFHSCTKSFQLTTGLDCRWGTFAFQEMLFIPSHVTDLLLMKMLLTRTSYQHQEIQKMRGRMQQGLRRTANWWTRTWKTLLESQEVFFSPSNKSWISSHVRHMSVWLSLPERSFWQSRWFFMRLRGTLSLLKSD